jgi:pimeloyl-ACP methyl ester carboxylesterase
MVLVASGGLGRDVSPLLRALSLPGAEVVLSLADEGSRRAFVQELRAVVDQGGQYVSARDRLYLATRPTLIVWGGRDSMIPVGHARRAHAAIAGSRLEIFPDADHFPHAECPDRFAEVLVSFMEATTAVNAAAGDRLTAAEVKVRKLREQLHSKA